MCEISVPGLSRQQIEKLASRVRGLIEAPANKPFPIVPLLEVLSVPVDETGPSQMGLPAFDLEIVEDEELQGNYAEYHPASNTMVIRQSVYEGAYEGNGRDRFTLAHELGHFLLHSHTDYRFARSKECVPTYQNPEWQANTFASMLLMPRDEISNLSTEEVAQRYQVSKSAAQIALSQTQSTQSQKIK